MHSLCLACFRICGPIFISFVITHSPLETDAFARFPVSRFPVIPDHNRCLSVCIAFFSACLGRSSCIVEVTFYASLQNLKRLGYHLEEAEHIWQGRFRSKSLEWKCNDAACPIPLHRQQAPTVTSERPFKRRKQWS